MNDFEPIALLANTPQLIIARKDFPASDVHDLIAWLKGNPDKATAATVGAAGGAQVAGIYFQQATGTRFPFVPYRGGAPAMQDLIAGQAWWFYVADMARQRDSRRRRENPHHHCALASVGVRLATVAVAARQAGFRRSRYPVPRHSGR
jgi:hypothetical protein